MTMSIHANINCDVAGCNEVVEYGETWPHKLTQWLSTQWSAGWVRVYGNMLCPAHHEAFKEISVEQQDTWTREMCRAPEVAHDFRPRLGDPKTPSHEPQRDHQNWEAQMRNVPYPRRPTDEERKLKPNVVLTLDEGGLCLLLDREQAIMLIAGMVRAIAKEPE